MSACNDDPSSAHSQERRDARAVAGFDQEEAFSSILTVGTIFKKLIPTLIMLFFITWLLAGAVLSTVGVPDGLVTVGGAIVSGGSCALMTRFKKKQLAKVVETATLTLSSFGADMQDGNMRVQMPWSQMERIAEGDMMSPLKVGQFSLLARAVGAIARASFRRKEMALCGVGRISVNAGASALLRSTVKQNLGGQDPEHAQTGVILTHYDKDWENGRIAQWIAAYRPDLMS